MVDQLLKDVPEFLAGGGEMGQRIRNFDWSKTSLGPVASWPRSLRTCVQIMLTSRQPIWIGWGRELVKLYNDPYKAIVGGKHPWALGQPASVVWKDIWRDIEPMLRQVMVQNEGTYVESQLLIMERNGYPEETYYTFSYTPIAGDNGGTEGMICFNTDDTERIISERQLTTLTRLGKAFTDPKSVADVFERVLDTLKANPHDFPFALLYELSGDKAMLVGSTNIEEAPHEINLNANDETSRVWGRASVTRKYQVLEDLQKNIGSMPRGAWPVSSDRAIVLPIAQRGQANAYGLLAVGINPYRLLDEQYVSFFELITDRIATGVATIYTFQEERRRLEGLAEIDRAKTIFFSNISHEFRTPLTLLLAPLEDLLNDPEINEINRERGDVAYRNGIRMQKLVNLLLDFSRIEAGRMEASFSAVDIVSLTEDLVSNFRSAIEKAGMTLIFRSEKITDPVYVDVDMWEKIILNLVSNAFKYSEAGSIEVSITKANRAIEVAVKDTGVGIPAEEIEKIFERFHRVQNVKGRSQEGTGIGLAMVKELVKINGGTISVKSKQGVGSVFTVSLLCGADHLKERTLQHLPTGSPVSSKSSAYIEEALQWVGGSNEDGIKQSPSKGRKRNVKKYTVLLADDNADMRKYVQRLLDTDYYAIVAADGEEAYASALKHTPDLILTDIMMPKLDGFGLLKKLKTNLSTRNIPVIFLSARAGEEAQVEGLNAGADDYLTKPFSSKELMARVSNHIAISIARRQTEKEFYNLFIQSPAHIHVFRGPDHVVEFFHPLGVKFTGKDLTGMKIREGLPQLEGQGFFEMLDKVFDEGNTVHARNSRAVFADEKGEPRDHYFDITYLPWKDLNGKVQGVLQFTFEVTESVEQRLRAEAGEHRLKEQSVWLEQQVEERTAALKDLNESLKLSNEDLQQFAHVASHDLKEPIRKIKTFGNRLADEYGNILPDKGNVFLTKIMSATDRIYAMVEGVLSYSTMSAVEQGPEAVDLNEVMKSIQADLEVLIQEKKATFKISKLPTIEGAPVLLYQLFYNLINNSLKFSRDSEPALIYIQSSVVHDGGKKFAKIALIDNGIGFEQEHAERIFTTFTRLNSKDKYEGTGLGLALCKKIVQRHGGSISATAEKGKGAEFTILLPIK